MAPHCSAAQRSASGAARCDLLHQLLRERKADAAIGIVEAALCKGEVAPAGAVLAVQRLERFGLLIPGEGGEVDAGDLVGLRRVLQALLVLVLGVDDLDVRLEAGQRARFELGQRRASAPASLRDRG